MKAVGPIISILIVDDHPVLRSGLEAMLVADGSYRVVASVDHAQAAIQVCRSVLPDVVLLDVRMPDCDGFQLLSQLLARFPSLRVLMMAGVPLRHDVARARELGACGYLPKSVDHQTILSGIRCVHEGGTVFMQGTPHRRASLERALTDREIEVLEHLARGLSREDIATALHISAETVKSHVKSILPKLHAADRTEAVARAFELGLLHV
jgi:two-component system, NarL family, response regulator